MGKLTNNPISLNQITDTGNLDLKCFDTNSDCYDFKSLFQSLIDEVCNQKVNLNTIGDTCIDFTQLGENFSLSQVLQKIIASHCALKNTVDNINITTPANLNLEIINYCLTENWELNDNDCLQPQSPDGIPILNPSVGVIFQTLIKRIISLQKLLRSQNNTIQELSTLVSNIQGQITLITETCCNTTLINRITALESAVSTIQSNCCP